MNHTGAAPLTRERLAFGGGWTAPTVPSRGRSAAMPVDPIADDPVSGSRRAVVQDWGVMGLLGFTAALLVRPQDQLSFLSPFHLAELFALVGGVTMVVQRLTRGLPLVRITPELIGVLGVGFAMAATAPFSVWPGGVVSTILDIYVKVIVIWVLTVNTLMSRRRFEQFTWLILLCCGYVSMLALLNYARGIKMVEGGRLDGPLSGLMGNPNDFAMNLVTFLPLALVIALTRHHSSLKRLAAAGITAAMFAVVILTRSRSGALGLVVMIATLIVIGRRVRPGFATITLVATLAAVPFMPSSFWMRMSTIVNPAADRRLYTGSREARSNVMQDGINTFLEYPLTGVGAGQFKNYNPPGRKERWLEAHNAFIQVAAETGIIGLLAFGFLVVRGIQLSAANLRRLGRRPRRRFAAAARTPEQQVMYGYAVALTAGLAGWIVCAMFASVAYGWTFYYLLALICTSHALIAAMPLDGLTSARTRTVPPTGRRR
jgi:O-antigen ligase